MPRRPLRCVVDLSIHAVTAPGVWLPSKEDVYLSVSMFGQYRNTKLLASVFPLLIHERFHFEKTFYTALDPSDVADYLEDELVIFELVQLSEYINGAVRLASIATNARDFLYPFPSLAPTYSSTDRELLLARTVAFPGIPPKLEFATKTVIKESISPELDALENALEEERARRAFRKSRRSSPRRSRSPSLSRRISDLGFSSTIDNRPPFVVRKLDAELIGRVPGGGPDSHAKSNMKKLRRSLALSKSDTFVASSRCPLCEISLRRHGLLYPGHTRYCHEQNCWCHICGFVYKCTLCDIYQRYFGHPYWGHPSHHTWLHCQCKKVIREPLRDPSPVFRSKLKSSDEDAEVAELTSHAVSSYRPRPRSASPIMHRSSFSERYGRQSYSPNYYSLLAERVRRRLDENRHLARLSLYSPYSPYISALDRLRLSPYYYYYYYDTLYDLELATTLAKNRRYIPLY